LTICRNFGPADRPRRQYWAAASTGEPALSGLTGSGPV
jgi:hypothetical protein